MGKNLLKQNQEPRIAAILRGAFAGSPTPLKDIPKKNGESRVQSQRKKIKRKVQRD